MKNLKSIGLVLWVFLLVACQGTTEVKQTEEKTEPSHQWTENDVETFVKNCNVIAVDFAGEKAADYCNCVRDLILAERPDPEIAHEMEDKEWMKLLENSECHKQFEIPEIENKWTPEVEESFKTGCLESAIGRFGNVADAEAFCSCALNRTKNIIPNPNYAIMMSEEEIEEINRDCVPTNE